VSCVLFSSLLWLPFMIPSVILILPSSIWFIYMSQSVYQSVSILVPLHDHISSTRANSASAAGKINRIFRIQE
jgi:hypothetical protein